MDINGNGVSLFAVFRAVIHFEVKRRERDAVGVGRRSVLEQTGVELGFRHLAARGDGHAANRQRPLVRPGQFDDLHVIQLGARVVDVREGEVRRAKDVVVVFIDG